MGNLCWRESWRSFNGQKLNTGSKGKSVDCSKDSRSGNMITTQQPQESSATSAFGKVTRTLKNINSSFPQWLYAEIYDVAINKLLANKSKSK